MKVIASQRIDTNDGHLTVELLQEIHTGKFFIYDSDSNTVMDMLNTQHAINEYASYTVQAVVKALPEGVTIYDQ